MDLARQRVLITGGTRGIGLALARAFHAAGAQVAVCGRDAERLEWLRSDLPQIRALRCDLAEPSQLVGFVARLHHDFGMPTMLVHNAAVQHTDLWLERDPQQIVDRSELEVRVNLTSVLQLTALLLPDLLAAEEAALVLVSSVVAYAPKRSAPTYSATKAALHGFARALRDQLSATRVRVVEVVPPLVDTEMTAGRGRNKLPPAAVAEAVLAGLAAGAREIFVGKARGFRWLHRLAPALAARLVRDA